MNKKILLVEDDPEIVRLLSLYFTKHQFQVIGCDSPSIAHRLLTTEKPTVVILDVMLPEASGIEFCREVRKYSSVPIIMLSALGQVTDRIVGLEIGADDYMTKPFEPRELLARINSLIRRVSYPKTQARVLKFNELEINTREQKVFSSGCAVDLSSTEYRMLIALVQKAGQVIERDTLLEQVRGTDSSSYSRSIDTMISRLRTKLQDNSQDPRFIKTVWGVGYVFVAAERS